MSKPPDQADQEILDLLRKPDRAHHEEGVRWLLVTHGGRVARLLLERYRGLLSEDDVWDCVNEALFKVWQSAGTFDHRKGTLGGWLFTIAQRSVIDFLRGPHGRGRAQSLREYDPPDGAEDEPTTETQARVALLARAVEDLPGLQCAIILADLAAGTQADDHLLARQHDTTVNSVRVSRLKAHENLRKWFERRGYEVERPERGRLRPETMDSLPEG